jgi:hypothetical protein
MSVFREKVGSVCIEIHDVDHGPPHCQVSCLPGGATARVDLLTLRVSKPPGSDLPKAVRQRLRARQEDMLAAWERVQSVDWSG